MASPRPFELMVLTWKRRKETLLIEMTARLWFFVPNDKLQAPTVISRVTANEKHEPEWTNLKAHPSSLF
jgi:hypothetical protein